MRRLRALFFCLLAFSCDRDQDREKKASPEPPRPLWEPKEAKLPGRDRCSAEENFAELTLRARLGKNGVRAALDIGEAAALSDGQQVLGALRSLGGETRAFLIVLEEGGRHREIPLSVVHGAVELPVVAARNGYAFALLSDNEATSHRLRLARVATQGEPRVTWGPEVSMERDESMAYSISIPVEGSGFDQGIIVWDDYLKAEARSVVMALTFSVASMKANAPSFRLSPPGHDAASPRVVAHDQGFYVTWLQYDPLGEEDDKTGLVSEPTTRLFAQRLNEDGRPIKRPEPLSDEARSILAYDPVATSSGLLVAARAAVPNRTLGSDRLTLLRWGFDGSIQAGEAHHELLGPGAPVLLQGQAGPPWLVARGEEDQVLIGSVRGVGVDWGSESSLAGQIPLGRRSQRLLTMAPRGLDWIVSAFRCSFDQ